MGVSYRDFFVGFGGQPTGNPQICEGSPNQKTCARNAEKSFVEVKKPRLLILDEATSALDEISQAGLSVSVKWDRYEFSWHALEA